jgi:hypothetical protein
MTPPYMVKLPGSWGTVPGKVGSAGTGNVVGPTHIAPATSEQGSALFSVAL